MYTKYKRTSKKSFGKKRRLSKRKSSKRRSSKRKLSKRKSSKRRSNRISKRRFGRMPALQSIMGNYAPSNMNTFQQYTGMSAPQMEKHNMGISKSIKSNFYTNIN